MTPQASPGLADPERLPVARPELPAVRTPAWQKRLLDLAVVIPGLLLLSPVLLVAAVAVALSGPVFFRQTRIGQGGRPFTIWKFRTMVVNAGDLGDTPHLTVGDDPRVTPVGRWLRATKVDELPQLLNVLRGEMSLVGPRPLLPEYLPRYSPQQARRHEVRPGLTGWAQVNGRNALTWERKFALDVWYVDHASLALDLRILLLTVGRVFRRADILPEGQSEVAAFLGSVPAPLSVPAREVSGAAAHTRSLP